mgnify:FL=1
MKEDMLSDQDLIRRTKVVCLEGGKTQTADIAYRLATKEIERGGTVYWVDGGSLLDPTRIIPSTSQPSTIHLDRLQACRAFTAHQMAEIFKRMEKPRDGESPLEDGSLLIVTNAHSMFLDTQLGVVEGNMLLRNTLHRIRRISRTRGLAVLMTADRWTAPPTPTKVTALLEKISDEYIRLPIESKERGSLGKYGNSPKHFL